jgi:heme/copper-type cytochrome/quinol oxidase subunit 4
MFARRFSFRAVIVSWILAVVLGLIPLATALAGGGGTSFPH